MEIIFEDKDIIVVNKPSGIATQTKKVGEKDIVSELKNYLKGGYVGVVHRLDQPVSGLLVFAKNKNAAAKFSAQVSAKGEQGFQKEYTAIVCEGEELQTGVMVRLEDYMIKEKEGIARLVDIKDKDRYPDAKKAILTYSLQGETVIGSSRCFVLRVNLETGRFHQIRAQLSGHGMPIIGDLKYGSEKSRETASEAGIRRILLCADRLSFIHPADNKNRDFSIDPFREFLS